MFSVLLDQFLAFGSLRMGIFVANLSFVEQCIDVLVNFINPWSDHSTFSTIVEILNFNLVVSIEALLSMLMLWFRTADIFSFGVILFFIFTVISLIFDIFLTCQRSRSLVFFFRNKIIDQVVLSIMLLLFSILLVMSLNLFLIFLAFVGLNLTLYSFLAQYSFSLKAQESAIRYFVLGLLAAGIFLFGLFLIYLSFGTLDNVSIVAFFTNGLLGISPLAVVGSILICLVFLFKLSAFPLQQWAPDVYEGSSWFAISVLTLIVKPIFILGLLRLVGVFYFAFGFIFPLLVFSGLGSILVGALGARAQQKFKRFLAFSSISHIGFMVSLIAMSPFYTTLLIWYLLSYIFANFIILFLTSGLQIFNFYTAKSSSVVYLSELAFLNAGPMLMPTSTPFSIALCSLAGLPPFMGFFTKLGLILSCYSTNSVWTIILVLGIFVAMPISIFNYLRVLRVLWFGSGLIVSTSTYANIHVSSGIFFWVRFFSCLLLFFGFIW